MKKLGILNSQRGKNEKLSSNDLTTTSQPIYNSRITTSFGISLSLNVTIIKITNNIHKYLWYVSYVSGPVISIYLYGLTHLSHTIILSGRCYYYFHLQTRRRLSSRLYFSQVGSWSWGMSPTGWIPEPSIFITHILSCFLSLRFSQEPIFESPFPPHPLFNYSGPMESNLALKSPSSPWLGSHQLLTDLPSMTATASRLTVPRLQSILCAGTKREPNQPRFHLTKAEI